MKLINKNKIVAEIERLKKIQLSTFSKGETQESSYDSLTCISVYNEILSFINTLEVKEVDLEKEIMKYIREIYDRDTTVRDVAKHFFELGLKAQKGE